MARAIIWTKDLCTYCTAAKSLMNVHGIEFEEKKVGREYTREQLLEAVPDARTVPQIFLDEKYVGGYTELKALLDATR
jgi:glutaredoxin 3